jgi:hypothetical protein
VVFLIILSNADYFAGCTALLFTVRTQVRSKILYWLDLAYSDQEFNVWIDVPIYPF